MIKIRRFVSYSDDRDGGSGGKFLDESPLTVPDHADALRRCLEYLEDMGVATAAVGLSNGYEVTLPNGRLIIRITYSEESSD